MSQERPPPPEAEECLIHSRVSRYKGGTLIAEDVLDLATHVRRLADPDGYRPDRCPRCGGSALHRHDYVRRSPRDEHGTSALTLVRFICADLACEATWRMLPAFVARCLWRLWSTVERTTSEAAPSETTSEAAPSEAAPSEAAPSKRPTVTLPQRTVKRWRSRLASEAKQLVVLLATTGGVLLEDIGKTVGLGATRSALVAVYAVAAASPSGQKLAAVAALVHRIERGIRLM
jgi:hypothetical protein